MGKPRDLANVVATGNILADGAVAPAELTGVTSTAAEINILDGVTATAAELNLLDGVTATTAELNHVDGVTSNVQTQMDTKAPVADPTFTGTATAPTVNASTALQIGGVAVTATAAELNKMDGVTVSASDINTVTAKAPTASPTFTGDVTIPDKIVHDGDTNTAIRFADADTVTVETGGTERMRIDDSGRVNVAATTGNEKLNVAGALGVSGASANFSGGNERALVDFTGTLARFGHVNGASGSAKDVSILSGGGEKFRFGSSGQFGIGGATYGTSGQVLTSGGSGAAPTWADASGGGGIELTTSEAVVEGDTLAMDFTTGKVKKVTRVGGNGYDYVYDSNSSSNLKLYDVIHIPEISKIAVLGQRSDGKRVIILGTFNGGGWAWGTPYVDATTGDTGGAKLVWAANVSRLVSLLKDTGGSGPLKYRMYSVSGTSLSATGAGTVTTSNVQMAESATQIQAVYSPTHQRIIVAFPKFSPDCYRMVAGGLSNTGISWGNETADIKVGGAGVENFGLTVNGSQIVYGFYSQYDQRYFVGAATLSGSTFSGAATNFTNLGSNYTYDHQARGYMFHVTHTGASNTYAYGIQNSNQDGFFYQFTVSGTTISLGSVYQLHNQSSSTTYGYNYGYDPTNDRLFSVRTNNKTANSGTNASNLRDNDNNDAVAVHGGDSGFVRSAVYDATGEVFTFIGAQNPTYIYYYAPQVDNYHKFIGTALEAASANTTVKIATVGNIGTGFSGLTPGNVYKINFNGAWQQHANSGQYNYAFGEAQRARSHMVALTATTGLITNSFSQDL